MKYRIFSLIVVFSIIILASATYADDYTSTNFITRDPLMTSGGSFSSSTNFQLFGAVSQISIGTSTSASFGVNAGFLYFPTVTTPVVSATAGNGQVALSWTVSAGYLGWNVSGYNIGQSTNTGGPYTYSSSLGNVTSSTRTGLINGTTYYFIVRAEDGFGNSVATSSEVSATPSALITTCGDGSCNGRETCFSCVADCGRCGGIILDILQKMRPPVLPLVLAEAMKIPPVIKPCIPKTDLNCDKSIGLQDLSIFLYLMPLSFPNPADFNNDEKVDFKDFSILLSGWNERLLSFTPGNRLFAEKEEVASSIKPEEQVAAASRPVKEIITSLKKEAGAKWISRIGGKIKEIITDIAGKIINFGQKIKNNLMNLIKRRL